MKHLKLYENFETYKVDDYVLLTDLNFKDKNGKWVKLLENLNETKGKILKIEIVNTEKNDNTYFISLMKHFLWVNTSNIIRKLTPEEIEEYELKKEAEKYNL